MAIDVKKERRLNDMNALAESIKLGTELRRMDESIPTAEDMAEWNGAVEDLGDFYKGENTNLNFTSTDDSGLYSYKYISELDGAETQGAVFLAKEYNGDGVLTNMKQLIITPFSLRERLWGSATGWGTSKYFAHIIKQTKTANSPGDGGDLACDDDYFYICTNDNTWIRFAKTAWE